MDIYKSNDLVKYNFCEQVKFGMNLNTSRFPSAPREIIVRLDHPSYAVAFYDEWEREILLTLFHEVGHLIGKDNDDKAENYAIEKANTIYNQLK